MGLHENGAARVMRPAVTGAMAVAEKPVGCVSLTRVNPDRPR
jgi:hypothetical protein